VLQALRRTLLETSLRMALSPLQSLLGQLAGGLVKSMVGAALPNITPFAKGGVVAAPTYFPLGRGLGVMGERGTEAVMPLARGPDGRLGVAASGGGRAVNVVVNIATPDADSFRRSEAQVSAALARAVARGQRGL
jgi:phage-related minor tail protein